MEGGCKTFKWLADIKKQDKNKYKSICRSGRPDGPYIEVGENDNLIVSKLNANPNALGVFGYSFLDQNSDTIQGSMVDGAYPTFENIADCSYKVSRPLYFYVKNAHAASIPGIKEYVREFTSRPLAAHVSMFLPQPISRAMRRVVRVWMSSVHQSCLIPIHRRGHELPGEASASLFKVAI